MSDFGDTEPADAVDASAPHADPEQVARLFHEEGRRLGENRPGWHDLTDEQRERAVAIVVAVVRKLRAEGTTL